MQSKNKKGKWLRRISRVIVALFILFIIACFVFDHYYQFRKTDEELQQIYAENKIPATIHYYETHGRKLRYVSVGKDSANGTLLFLHGSPGSMSYYGRRFIDKELSAEFKIYAVDRPGYGYSGLGDPEPSIQKQSEMIRPVLDSLNHAKHPIIIVGSSYGSSIACRMAIDHPELIDGLVLTGPSLGPGLEKYFWFTKLIEFPAIRWFIPRMFRSANTEKTFHKGELEKMLPYWKNLKIPVAYLQGVDDEIIDTANASFAKRNMINVPWLHIEFIKGRQHRLAQYEWPRFKEAIIKVYARVKK